MNENILKKILLEINCDSEKEKACHIFSINFGADMLSEILSSIKKWHNIGWEGIRELNKQLDAECPQGFEYDHPINDIAFTMSYTENAIYGSLAVSIAAYVEDQLDKIYKNCDLDVLKNGKKIDPKPQFDSYMYTFKRRSNIAPENIACHERHVLVRELANRYKHSGGKANQDFIHKYGVELNIQNDGDEIPFRRLDWNLYICQAKDFLIDFIAKLYNSKFSLDEIKISSQKITDELGSRSTAYTQDAILFATCIPAIQWKKSFRLLEIDGIAEQVGDALGKTYRIKLPIEVVCIDNNNIKG